MPTPSPSPTGAIAAVLADAYGLAVRDLVQLPIGQGTVNYRATCDDREVFVKNYPTGTDLAAEEHAIGLSELARRHNIPAAPVVANRHAQLLDASTPHAISVWQWMPGRVTTVLNTRQCAQAGHALGRIHAVFATLPESAAPAPEADAWLRQDPARLEATIDRLLGIIAERTRTGTADAFDAVAEQTLRERRAMLERLPKLLAELPSGLTTQVLHSDYSPVNLLFDKDTLTAVLDFRPPNPFLLSYDLGRMAFYPNTVASDPDWMQAARTLIAAYQAANPAASDVDILACARVALLQLLGSLYGVKQHYLKPGLFQNDLDEFWLLRHRTVASLLDHLPDTDQLLADLVATPNR
ncbi:phosphotransferase enzyme family protein [Streptomyces antibioticus]|uniref:phosphotransferase enzyme family protein n=1 Tax=Streptomyces antibioticus TaxID=1890 RepID=UPI0019616FC2|nr:phosphotransferase [Streptomyces sp. S9]